MSGPRGRGCNPGGSCLAGNSPAVWTAGDFFQEVGWCLEQNKVYQFMQETGLSVIENLLQKVTRDVVNLL